VVIAGTGAKVAGPGCLNAIVMFAVRQNKIEGKKDPAGS
jgi:hypothetical protein